MSHDEAARRLLGVLRQTAGAGLEVHCELDANAYPKGIAVSDADMAAINMVRADFHGEWN